MIGSVDGNIFFLLVLLLFNIDDHDRDYNHGCCGDHGGWSDDDRSARDHSEPSAVNPVASDSFRVTMYPLQRRLMKLQPGSDGQLQLCLMCVCDNLPCNSFFFLLHLLLLLCNPLDVSTRHSSSCPINLQCKARNKSVPSSLLPWK